MRTAALQLGSSTFHGTQVRIDSARSCPHHARQNFHVVALKDLAGTVVSIHMNKTAVIEVGTASLAGSSLL